MFYYSETKYLYELADGEIKAGMKGFVKITFRGERGTIQLHFDGKQGNGNHEVSLSLYQVSDGKKIHQLTKQNVRLENGDVQISHMLKELPYSGEECWFGCMINDGEKQFTENSDYTRMLSGNKEEEKTQPDEHIINVREEETDRKTEKNTQENIESSNFADTHKEQDCGSEHKEEGYYQDKDYINWQENIIHSKKKQEPKKSFWENIYISDLSKLKDSNKEWERFIENSFLCHGFYNYKHVLATDTLLGVPGNYYDREKQVAAMFGFDGFLPVKELESYLLGEIGYSERQIVPGTFGYYFCRLLE